MKKSHFRQCFLPESFLALNLTISSPILPSSNSSTCPTARREVWVGKVVFGGNKETTRGNKEKLFPACLSHFLLWRKFWGRNSFDCSWAELGKVTKQRTGSHWQKMKTIWYKLTQSWTIFGAWSMDWGSETSLSRSSHFIFLHGQRHWPVAKKYKAWNMEYPLKNATLQLLQARSKCCHPYSLNIIQFIPTNIDNSSIKCRFFVSGSGKQIQYSAFYTFTASGVIGSISDRSKSTIFQQEARYCYDYQLN